MKAPSVNLTLHLALLAYLCVALFVPRQAHAANLEVPVRFVSWSDATAISDKLDLAKRHNLKGVAVFKVDREEDPGIWKQL